MKKHILLSLAAIILSFTSCVKPEEGGKDNPPAPQEQIVIPSTVDVKPVVSPEGGDTRITFTAASAWTASVISTKADSWVDVNPKSGNAGAAEIKITTTPNDTYVERNATIQIKCGTQTEDIVLTQKQLDNITVTTDKVELGVEGGTFTVKLKTNIDFSYEIDGDWIKYVSTKAYSDKTLTFTAEPNDGVQRREGSVTVKGGEFTETVKVYQSGEEPTLVISQNEYNLAAEGGSITVEVSSNVAVTMTIPESANWITENQTKSVSTSTFYLDVAANETKEARSAEITFSNEESGLSEKITVNQEGKLYVPVVPEMVDLGLPSGLKWASFNLGASKPEEYGLYYQWGDTQGYDYSDEKIFNWKDDSGNITYKWCNGAHGMTKYVPANKDTYWSGSGYPDFKIVLDPEDDAAHVALDGKWRMPTYDEWNELFKFCSCTWTYDYNGTGVSGHIVKSKANNSNSIFLPDAGCRDDVGIELSGYGCYWSSSLDTSIPINAIEALLRSYNDRGGFSFVYRYLGHSIRPVYGDAVPISVNKVSLDKTHLSLLVGQSENLTAIIFPSNAFNKNVTWTSSNAFVEVSSDGVVTAVSLGTANITVTTADGGYTATCTVEVSGYESQTMEAIDLGLSVKWASCNVGASRPEECGDYFAWGETEPKSYYDIKNYKFYYSDENLSAQGLSKYNTESHHGKVDNKTTLDPYDDAARANCGEVWRMPTIAEWKELLDNSIEKDYLNFYGTGVRGTLIISKINGKSIFLPSAGYYYDTRLLSPDIGCYYWSSSLDLSDSFCAYDLSWGSGTMSSFNGARFCGLSVRPVSD